MRPGYSARSGRQGPRCNRLSGRWKDSSKPWRGESCAGARAGRFRHGKVVAAAALALKSTRGRRTRWEEASAHPVRLVAWVLTQLVSCVCARFPATSPLLRAWAAYQTRVRNPSPSLDLENARFAFVGRRRGSRGAAWEIMPRQKYSKSNNLPSKPVPHNGRDGIPSGKGRYAGARRGTPPDGEVRDRYRNSSMRARGTVHQERGLPAHSGIRRCWAWKAVPLVERKRWGGASRHEQRAG